MEGFLCHVWVYMAWTELVGICCSNSREFGGVTTSWALVFSRDVETSLIIAKGTLYWSLYLSLYMYVMEVFNLFFSGRSLRILMCDLSIISGGEGERHTAD
jgi:hypothetical protein